MLVIPEMAEESPLTISSSQLTPGARAVDDFRVALVKPPESGFIASESLSNIDHIRHHVCVVIELDKKFDFSPGPYQLNILSLFALTSEVVDEIAYRYSRLPLERANTFYQKHIEQEIAQFDIIVLQAANYASTFKATLTQVTKRKAKYKEQLELIQTIKTNNLNIEDKIQIE